MTVPTHFRIVFRGDFVSTPEHWSFGMHFSRSVDGIGDADVGDIDESAVTTALTTFFANANSAVPGVAKATDWRAYQIGTDGKMEGNPLVVDVSQANIVGTGSGYTCPPQIACCVTTIAVNRGPARFGRFYLPTKSNNLGSDGRLAAATALQIAEATSTFMKSVSNAIDLPGLASSQGLNISEGNGGTKQTIDRLAVGRALDTLRNRRKSMVEDRQETGHIDW